jgi:hypothetical protein
MIERKKNNQINQKVLDRIKSIFKDKNTNGKADTIEVENFNGVF